MIGDFDNSFLGYGGINPFLFDAQDDCVHDFLQVLQPPFGLKVRTIERGPFDVVRLGRIDGLGQTVHLGFSCAHLYFQTGEHAVDAVVDFIIQVHLHGGEQLDVRVFRSING